MRARKQIEWSSIASVEEKFAMRMRGATTEFSTR